MSDDKPELKTREVKLKDWPSVSKSESQSRQAAKALRNASIERCFGHQRGGNAVDRLKDIQRLEAVAADRMKPSAPPTVRCGEVTYASGDSGPAREIADTLRNPDQAAIEASVTRTDLLLSAPTDLVALAVDAAASANANNSFEKMLAHQLAMIHTLAMKTGARALEFEKRRGVLDEGLTHADAVELSRLSQATSRLSSSFQDGLLTLQRLHNGSAQTLTVRHVTVEAGGQAIIGNVKAGGRHARKPGRGKPK